MPSRNCGTVGFGAFNIDLDTGEVRRRGVKVKLQGQPFAVLALLLERPGELVTREELKERIWGAETYVDFDQGLNKAIKKIRAALGDSAEQPKYVETLPKRGYRFLAPLNSSHPESENNQPSTRQSAQLTQPGQYGQPENVIVEVPVHAHVRRGSLRRRTSQIAGALAAGLFLIFLLSRHNWERERELRLRQLTTNNAENFIESSVVSPDGRYFLYGDEIGIHLRVIATGETHTFDRPKALSDEDSWYPTAWYPDQTHFIAVSETLTTHGIIPTSWTVSLLGDGATELRQKAIARSVSPDGSQVAFTSGGIDSNQEIGIMGARGEDAKIVSTGDELTAFQMVQWSPDGRRLFDVRTHWLGGSDESSKVQYVIESRRPDGAAAIPVASYVIASDFPDWRGGGSFCLLGDGRVIYTRNVSAESLAGNDDTNLWEIKVKPETGEPDGAARPVTKWFGQHLDNVSVSRDGKTLVLQKSNWQLHTYLGEISLGSGLQPLRRMTLEDSDDLPFAWTPDSRAVIFISNRAGAYRIYKQITDRKVAEPITTGPDVVAQARLSPDGQWIIYSTEARTGHPPRVMRIAISGGAPQVIMETRVTDEVQCPSAAATRCIALEEGETQIFRSFDVMAGNPRELFKRSYWNGGWAVSPRGSIGILRQDTRGGRVQILSQSGSLEREITLAPWSHFSGLDWSADPGEFYTSSVGPSGATLLRVGLTGRIQPLWLLKGSRVTWAIAAPDGHHIAVLGKSSYSNAWVVENF